MTDGRTPSEEKAATTSLGDLLGNVTKDVSTLMRQEIALAKAEISDSAKKAGKGAGLLGGAGYAGIMAVFFLSVALMYALGYWFDNLAWAAVVVAVIWAVIGLVMYLQGRKQLKTVQGAPRTADSVKKIPEAMKRNEADR
jgi:hypothetical protein